jgi:hypothetical protein
VEGIVSFIRVYRWSQKSDWQKRQIMGLGAIYIIVGFAIESFDFMGVVGQIFGALVIGIGIV